MGEAPLQTSFVFGDVVILHVHNQQEYLFIVDHEIVVMLGWQWSLHAMVREIGASNDEDH